MRVAFPVFENRLSPLFDEARHVLIVDLIGDGPPVVVRNLALKGPCPQRLAPLLSSGATVLLCGAISREPTLFLQAHQITVLSGIRGEWTAILEAFRHGSLAAFRRCIHRNASSGTSPCQRRRRRSTAPGDRHPVSSGGSTKGEHPCPTMMEPVPDGPVGSDSDAAGTQECRGGRQRCRRRLSRNVSKHDLPESKR